MSEREQLIARVRDVAGRLGVQSLTKSEFKRQTGVSEDCIYKHFDGWRELCGLAGLAVHTRNLKLNDMQIFEAMRDAFMTPAESRNFRDHGHDPAGCDVVVCWEHNWPDCPKKVLELRSAIGVLAPPVQCAYETSRMLAGAAGGAGSPANTDDPSAPYDSSARTGEFSPICRFLPLW